MRKFIDGNGADSTTAVKAHLLSEPKPVIFTLVVIQLARWLDSAAPWVGSGVPAISPYVKTFYLTDCPAAIKYNPLGTFQVAAVKHDAMSFGIGVEYQGFNVVWSPTQNDIVAPAVTIGWFASAPVIAALEAARRGFFDGAFISVYKVVMPTIGNPMIYDANTYGACLLHLGAVEEIKIEGMEVSFKVGSIIDQQDQQAPSQLIGPNSRFASVDPMAYSAVSLGSVTTQDAVRWSGWLADRGRGPQSAGLLTGFNSGSAFFTPDTGYFDGGFVVWQFGPLTGMRRPIAHYIALNRGAGAGLSTFILAEPFPYDASLYDSGFAFGFGFDAYALRARGTDSSNVYNGFPYVPSPEDAF